MAPDLLRRRPDSRRWAFVALAWLLGLLLAAAAGTGPVSAGMRAQATSVIGTTVAGPTGMPQDIADAVPAPTPATEAEAASDGVPEVEEPGLTQASTLHCTGTDLLAVAAIAHGSLGNSPPRYRGQAPPANA